MELSRLAEHRQVRRLLYVAGPAIVWAATLVLGTGYVALRSLGATTFPWNDGSSIEQALFHVDAPRFLQSHIYAHNLEWFDFLGFLLHLSWFFLPVAFGLLITLFERRRMMEYFAWLLVGTYIACAMFVVLPVTPPWMEPGVTRILAARSFVEYTQMDVNPVAAFPSLHAGTPMMIALFLLIRCKRVRWAGYVAMGFTLAISFAVVYLGEHWIMDVLAGWALAGGVAVLFTSTGVRSAIHAIPGDPLAIVLSLDRLLNERSVVAEPRASLEVGTEAEAA